MKQRESFTTSSSSLLSTVSVSADPVIRTVRRCAGNNIKHLKKVFSSSTSTTTTTTRASISTSSTKMAQTKMASNETKDIVVQEDTAQQSRGEEEEDNGSAVHQCATLAKSHTPPPSSSDPPVCKAARMSVPNATNGNNNNNNNSCSATKKDNPPKRSRKLTAKSVVNLALSKTTTKHTQQHNQQPSHSPPEPIRYNLPPYLNDIVFPYHGEFYQSQCYDPRLLAQLMSEGFLPIATSRALLPKLHRFRSAIPPPLRSNVHISKSTRKKSGKFELSIDEDFGAVVKGCHEQHGISWLYPRIVAAFLAVHKQPDHRLDAMIFDEYGRRPTGTLTSVRIHSVEVWNVQSKKIVAGELGYSVGTVYTSLTGFSKEDSSGTVQLAALGVLLERCGFEMWDLGMGMDYKTKLGAVNMPKDDFVRVVRGSRVGHEDVKLKLLEEEWRDSSFTGDGNDDDDDDEKKKDGDGKELHTTTTTTTTKKIRVNARDIINTWRQQDPPPKPSKKKFAQQQQ